jgi:hypothetical protein
MPDTRESGNSEEDKMENETIIWTGALIRTLIICGTALSALIIFAVGSKFKWFSSISIGKNGLDVKATEQIVEKIQKEEAEKQFESGNVNRLLDDNINKCDKDLIDTALYLSNKLRRTLNIKLNKHVGCSGMRRSLASCLRYPLWEASRKNHFNTVLRPENTKAYLDNLLKEVMEEYETFALEFENNLCANNNSAHCPAMPPLSDLFDIVRTEIIHNWLLPIRKAAIECSASKLYFYKSFMPAFEDFNDVLRIKRTKMCVEKNEEYIKLLSRPPEAGEI